MKKLMVILVALFLIPLLAVPANASINCYHMVSSTDATATMRTGIVGPKRVLHTHIYLGYTACRASNGTRWSRPRWMRVTEHVNSAGSGVDCEGGIFPNGYIGTKYTPYFWDNHSGRNYRKTTFSTKCRSSNFITKIVKWSARSCPALYWDRENGPPRWRVRIHAEWRLGPDGQSSTKTKTMPIP
jgi:hypothetical protein